MEQGENMENHKVRIGQLLLSNIQSKYRQEAGVRDGGALFRFSRLNMGIKWRRCTGKNSSQRSGENALPTTSGNWSPVEKKTKTSHPGFAVAFDDFDPISRSLTPSP